MATFIAGTSYAGEMKKSVFTIYATMVLAWHAVELIFKLFHGAQAAQRLAIEAHISWNHTTGLNMAFLAPTDPRAVVRLWPGLRGTAATAVR